MSAQPDFKKVDVLATAFELASCMKEDPSFIERSLVQQGDELLAFYEDPNFGGSFQDLKKQKLDVIQMAMQDVSSGVMTLRSSNIGVSFRGRTLAPYIAPHGSSPSGTVVFSISWKNMRAFQNWRGGPGEDVDQDQINLAIYRLTVALSQLI